MYTRPFQFAILSFLTLPVLAAPLTTVLVKPASAFSYYITEAVVESTKTTQIAAETQGRITLLTVKAGDQVKAGQILLRIDARMAQQQVAGSQAQAAAANAQLFSARQTYERKNRLYEKHYISQAAQEQAAAEYKTALAQTRAQQAGVSIASVQTNLHTIVAPYSGTIASLSAEIGDMALPGKPLLTLYDSQKMRVVASLPESRIARLDRTSPLQLEISGNATSLLNIPAQNMTTLPTTDTVSHQKQVRLNLPENLAGISPGTFARLRIPMTGGDGTAPLLIPASAVMHRGELRAVYVVINGKAQLRQVRLGQTHETLIEIVSGLSAGEQVALNPLAAIASLKSKP